MQYVVPVVQILYLHVVYSLFAVCWLHDCVDSYAGLWLG